MITRAPLTLGLILLLAAAVFASLVVLRPRAESQDAGSATAPPDVRLAEQPTASPAPADSDPTCGTATVSYEAIEPTIANRAEGAAALVLATVESVGEARWNSEDGAAPDFADAPPRWSTIFRPVSLSVDTLARGDLQSATLEVRLLGGTVGCYTFVYENTAVLKPGQQYAFFLGPSVGAPGGRDEVTLAINEAWIVSDGLVTTPLEGEIPVAVFLATVERAPHGPLGFVGPPRRGVVGFAT